MTISLDTAFVATCLQTLESISGLIATAEAHCAEKDLAAAALTEARIAPDMWPFAKQVFECGHHSARAVAGVKAGVFHPEIEPVPSDFAWILLSRTFFSAFPCPISIFTAQWPTQF